MIDKAHRLYFAHPLNDYGTEREKKCLKLIKQEFPSSEIVNPNSKMSTEMYKLFGFVYFEMLVNTCERIVAVPFPDGEFGAGVYREMQIMENNHGPIYAISKNIDSLTTFNVLAVRPLSIAETRWRVHDKQKIRK